MSDDDDDRWTPGQLITFWFFFTVPGLVMMVAIGAAMWATLPIWIVLTLAVLLVDRLRR